jgi:hypothetical protein
VDRVGRRFRPREADLQEADAFPSILVGRRPVFAPKPQTARLCTIPREQLRIDDLSRQIKEGAALPLSQLGAEVRRLGWVAAETSG